jgi:hypothetical protein
VVTFPSFRWILFKKFRQLLYQPLVSSVDGGLRDVSEEILVAATNRSTLSGGSFPVSARDRTALLAP